MNMEQWWNDIFAGETEVLWENLPSATLSTTNPAWIDPGANPGLRAERPATNRLSHGTALLLILLIQNDVHSNFWSGYKTCTSQRVTTEFCMRTDLTGYWLLLPSGIVQSVPYTAAIFWFILLPHLSSNHSWFIHQRSIVNTSRDT
jgi:hypothetical protein